MTKLNQLLAVSKGVKAETERAVTLAHHQVQKPGPLSGISRTYLPKDDEGERLPPESTRVQYTARTALDEVRAAFTRLFDVTATIDKTNCEARGDVTVAGTVLAAGLPVSTLLFLEKKLIDLYTIVSKLPTLDPADAWTWSDSADAYESEPVQTTRTKKVPRNHVRAEATDKHPAQVEMYTEDVIVGTWTAIKFSGALPAAEVRAMLGRVSAVRDAVKYAREQANAAEVADVEIGAAILGYVLG